MKNHLTLSLLLALPLFAQAAPAAAVDAPCEGKSALAGMHDRSHKMGDEPMPHFLRGAALNDKQKDQVFKLMHEQAPALREKGKAAQQAMDELRQLGLSDKVDEARAKSLADKAASAHSEMALLRLKVDQQIFALLTPEQRSKIADGKTRR